MPAAPTTRLILSVEPGHLASWTYRWNNANVNAPYRLAQQEARPFQLWHRLANFNQVEPDGFCTPLMQEPPTVRDYRGHRRTLFPVREINLKAYADAILTQITWPDLGFDPRPCTGNRPSPPHTMLSHEDRAPGGLIQIAKIYASPSAHAYCYFTL